MKNKETKIFKVVNDNSIVLYSKICSPNRLFEMSTYPLYRNNLFLRRYIDNNRVNYKICYIRPEYYLFFDTDGIKNADIIDIYQKMDPSGEIHVCINISNFGWLLFKFNEDDLKSIYHNGFKVYDVSTNDNNNVNSTRNIYYNSSITLNCNKFYYEDDKVMENCKKLTGLSSINITVDDNEMPTDRINIYDRTNNELIYQSINGGNITRSIRTEANGDKVETTINALNNTINKIIYYYDNGVLKEDSVGREYNIITDNDYKNPDCPKINVKKM